MNSRAICVVGLGKIGLPLALQCARKGHPVVGADLDQGVVAKVNIGVPPSDGEPEAATLLASAVAAGKIDATTDTSAAVSVSDAVLVAVPMMLDDQSRPDFRTIEEATRQIADGIRPGTLVSYETTVPLGTTRRRLAPMLAHLTGLSVGVDLFVVHSPERVFSGRAFADLRRYPKLLGGVDEASSRRGVELYQAILDFDPRPELARANGVWDLGSAEAAELAKLAETTYRDVNIGLANEFARYAEKAGVDIFGVIEAANSQPLSHIHQPGAAVGGHCIPVYPHFYLHGDPQATIVRAGRERNAGQPAYLVGLLHGILGGLAGARVAVMGVSYRGGGIKEHAYSGVFPLVDALHEAQATPVVHDPLYGDQELHRLGLRPHTLGDPVDALIIHTAHAEYAELSAALFPGVRALLDGRNITRPELWSGVPRKVFGIG
jgi:nucleotide sugar dehydrogenase